MANHRKESRSLATFAMLRCDRAAPHLQGWDPRRAHPWLSYLQIHRKKMLGARLPNSPLVRCQARTQQATQRKVDSADPD